MKKKFKNVVGGDNPPDLGIINWSDFNSKWTGNLDIAEEHKTKKFRFGSDEAPVYLKYLYTHPKTHHFVHLKPGTTNLHPDNIISFQSYDTNTITEETPINYLIDEPPQGIDLNVVHGGKRIRKRKTNKRKTNKRKTFKKK
jgi:hypothetical protein